MEIRVHIYVNERVCLKQLTPNMGWAGGDARSVKNSELFVFKHDAIAMGRHTNMYGNGWGWCRWHVVMHPWYQICHVSLAKWSNMVQDLHTCWDVYTTVSTVDVRIKV